MPYFFLILILGLLHSCTPSPYEKEVKTIDTTRPASTAATTPTTVAPIERPPADRGEASNRPLLQDGWQWRVNKTIGYRIAMPCNPIVEEKALGQELSEGDGRGIGDIVVCQMTLEKIYYVAIMREEQQKEAYPKADVLKRMDQIAKDKIYFYDGTLLAAQETARPGCISKEYHWEAEFDEGLKEMRIHCMAKGPQFAFFLIKDVNGTENMADYEYLMEHFEWI